MSRRPQLPRALSVGRLEAAASTSPARALAASELQTEFLSLGLPARSLEITAWNNAEWTLIPPVVTNAIQEVRNGLQIVYDLLTSSNDRVRIALLEYQRITERLDSCCLEFGKRITALEMKLSSGCLRQDTILAGLRAQEDGLVQHRTLTREELDAHFERTKLLVDTAIGKFNPCSSAELDAIAIRLSENSVIQTLFQEARAREESLHASALQLMGGRLSEVEEKLDRSRRAIEELSNIIASSEKQLEKYQTRIGAKLRLLDELPTRFTQIADLQTAFAKVHTDIAELASKDVSNNIALITKEMEELRAIVLRSPSIPLNTAPGHTPRTAFDQDDFAQPQGYTSSEARKSYPLLVPKQRDKMNIPARLSDPSYSTSLTGQDDFEFYQGHYRRSIERVNPQRYKRTIVTAEDQ